MANPIEPTPTLSGADAEAFYRSIEEFKPDPAKRKFLIECVELARKLRF